MSRNYDNWGKLVTAVVRRDQLRQLAFCHSRNPSSLSSGSSDDSDTSFRMMCDLQEPFDFDELGSLESPIPEFDGTTKQVRPSLEESIIDEVSNPESKRYIIEERNGKICYMAGARKLLILMRRPSQYWGWTKHVDSRFSEVAVLHYGRCLDIRDRVQTQMLSPNTSYAAYLVFKLTTWSKGLQSVEAAVNFFDEESDRDAQERASSVFLQPRKGQWGSYAARRVDGWMEVEIGNFYVDGEDKAVEARVLELNSWKTGLIVEGIEFRPLFTESSQFSYIGRYELVTVPLPPCQTDDTAENAVFPPPFPIGDVGSEVNETMKVAENEETEESEFDMSLLQEFAPELDSKTQSSPPLSSTISPPLKSGTQLKGSRLRRIKGPNKSGFYSSEIQAENHVTKSRNGQDYNHVQEINIHDPEFDPTLKFCPELNLKKDSSLQDNGAGEETMAKLLLSQDETSLTSLSSDELFSRGSDSLCEVEYFFHGMKRMVERKEVEADDLKKTLLKNEVEAQLALAEKESELEELRQKVETLKVEAQKANEKIKEFERKLEDCDALAASAVEEYKNSGELKVEKHKFASKAFSIGFQFCVKQVLEVDPSFDTSGIDVKRLEASSSIVKI